MNVGVEVNTGDLNAAQPTQACTPFASGGSTAQWSKLLCKVRQVRAAINGDQQRSPTDQQSALRVRNSAKVVLPFELFAAEVNAAAATAIDLQRSIEVRWGVRRRLIKQICMYVAANWLVGWLGDRAASQRTSVSSVNRVCAVRECAFVRRLTNNSAFFCANTISQNICVNSEFIFHIIFL